MITEKFVFRTIVTVIIATLILFTLAIFQRLNLPPDNLFFIPKVGGDPVIVTPNSAVDIFISSPGILCTLVLKKASDQDVSGLTIPVARSYDGNDWEAVKGPYNLKFVCTNDACTATIPELPSKMHSFQLTSYSNDQVNLSLKDKASRFLEQATFGPTIESVSSLTFGASNDEELNINIVKWIDDQIYSQPRTSHREYFRKRANTRFRSTENIGSPLHPCAPQTRWRSYAFTDKDRGAYLQVSKTADDSAYLLSIENIPRTEVTYAAVENAGALAVGESFEICSMTVGVNIYILVGDSCQSLVGGNPPIQFISRNPSTPFYTITLSPEKRNDFSPLAGSSEMGDFFLKNGLNSSTCNSINIGDYPVYLDFLDGNWLAFDPRINLLDNTLDHVISDGGASAKHRGAKCANVPKTFVNIDSCILSSGIGACSSQFEFIDFEIQLMIESINALNELTGDFVYAISGLKPEVSPCEQDTRSRWLLVDMSQCSLNGTIDTETKQTLISLLNNAEGSSLRDITYTGGRCNVTSTTPSTDIDLYLQMDSMCWKLVHQDHYNVYDMTPWVSSHPGGPYRITEFATKQEAFLEFPRSHEMWRWNDNKHLLPLLGRLGDSVLYRDLPLSLKLEVVAEKFKVEDVSFSGARVIVCGSPGEIKNDHSMGETGFNMRLVEGEDDFPARYLAEQKQRIWTMVILESKDQLRQRMAWALSQILVVSPSNVQDFNQVELYFVYYDIFVRHAFGSYRDILKEVAYSPVMANMLSYHASKSAAYNWERFRTVNFADENFAREVMQLFTIGTVMLNIDGTPIISPTTNKPILSYTNDHIMSFARAWTGFNHQHVRGNIEINSVSSRNSIDPMQIIPEWRDIFPKINLLGGYIGDGYPLCVDLPDRYFLRKGAKYRLLGSSTTLELQSNPSSNIDAFAKSLLLNTISKLYSKLCNPETEMGHDCRWQNEVVLEENTFCEGQECLVDTLRLVRLTDSIFFEYLHPPCVRLPYYNNAKKVSTSKNTELMCADPKIYAASEACCESNNNYASARNCEYVGERMTFARAAERCENIGQQQCMFNKLKNCNSLCCSWVENYFWHDTGCQIQVKVDDSGYTALVHKPQDDGISDVKSSFQSDSINYFPVHWVNTYPSLSNNCGNGVCMPFNGSCLCNVKVVENVVFNSIPENATDILSQLHIGSVSPDTFDLGLYDSPIERDDMKVYLRKKSSFDVNTIFEIEVHQKKHYFKNIRSIVLIVDEMGQETTFSFRNPPHFINMVEADALDAHYETGAVLDDYFYHPNTAPFLATFFIQRFGISNPSPRYVKKVATAFTNGLYRSNFGSGEYGDLEAMIVAILLDSEARSPVVGFDPSAGSLREPLLKLIGFMRSMKFTTYPKYPEIAFRRDMSDQIGQMAHDAESVFSFFKQDYATLGSVQDSSLVAPEGQRYDTPTIIGLLNGLFSMVKYGLTSCYDGFGRSGDCYDLNEGEYDAASGKLSYIPTDPNNVDNVVDELAMLLTAGRLNQKSRNTIKAQYIRAGDSDSGLRIAQQLIVSSPEFHSTNFVEFSGESRKAPESKKASTKSYKSITYLMLTGGVDSFNILVPHSGCEDKDMFSEYQSVRAQAALSKNELLTIKTGRKKQICNTFGIHKDLSELKNLYEDGDALFFSNTGVLFEPVTKETWKSKTFTQLFAHNVQQRDTQQVDANQEVSGTGILGRMADVLTAKGYNTGSFATSGDTTSLIGEPLKSPSIYTLGRRGVVPFNRKQSIKKMSSIITDINNKTKLEFGLFGKTWSELLDQALIQTDRLKAAIDGIEIDDFPNTEIGRQLMIVSKYIRARETLNMDRQFFTTAMNGFDSHSNVFKTLNNLLPQLNDALKSFVKEMKAIGEWENVVLIVTSDFGRSLTPNSGAGTDHGWGGNYFMIGGGLDGGCILGEYPHDLTSKSPVMLSRGRVVPTTSWDSIMNGIAQWIGIESKDELDKVLPNRGKFRTNLFDETDIFLKT